MDRREFFKTTTAAAAVATAGVTSTSAANPFPAPHLARGLTELTLAVAWPDRSAGFADSAERLARRIEAATGGRLAIRTVAALNGGLEAVMLGEADLYHGSENHHLGWHTGLAYFAGLPYFCGLEPLDHAAWLTVGGGQSLWDEIGAELGVKPLLAGHSGRAPGLWSRAEIDSVRELKDQDIYIQGLAREVVGAFGARPAQLPAGEIAPALADGRLFAAEWGGALASLSLGIPGSAKHHIGLGINNAGTALSLGIRRSLWERLGACDQALIQACATEEFSLALAEARAHEAIMRDLFREAMGVKLEALPGDMMAALSEAADDIVARNGASSAAAQRVHESYMAFRKAVSGLEPIELLARQRQIV